MPESRLREIAGPEPTDRPLGATVRAALVLECKALRSELLKMQRALDGERGTPSQEGLAAYQARSYRGSAAWRWQRIIDALDA